MGGDGDVDDASAIVRQNDQHEQEAASCGRDHEEIRRHHLAQVIPEERAPGLRRRVHDVQARGCSYLMQSPVRFAEYVTVMG